MSFPTKPVTLCIIRNGTQVLMIYKKRGFGANQWNFPGGKKEDHESHEAAAIREAIEETGLTPVNLEERGVLEFEFEGRSQKIHCTVFETNRFEGELLTETDECRACWVNLEDIPYDKMWKADRHWIPRFLSGERSHIRYLYNGANEVIKSEIIR